MRRVVWVAIAAWSLWSATQAPSLRAEDRVVLAPLKAGGPRTTLRGEIVEYRGDELRFRSSAERVDTFDPRRILELDTLWPAGLAVGDAATARGEWDEAIKAYRVAAAEDARGWVKRRLLARVVGCLRDARRGGEAGEAFLALLRADPQSPDFGVIPLDWTSSPAESAEAEPKAREWLKQEAVPAAVLLGASWLASRSERPAALAALRRLSDERDARVAHLADAQRWRNGSADRAELDKRRAQIARMDDSLRPGPTFVLAQGLARAGEGRAAAIEYLRIPILWSDRRELSAIALFEAGRLLESPDDRRDAEGLYREIVSAYPASSVVEAARRKLESPAVPREPSKSP